MSANDKKKYYWLKLKRDFFKRHDIQIIESMPNGKDYLLFYLKLLCESVDHDGNLRFSDEIPYNEEMLATITNTNVDIVRSAVKIFINLQMMEILDDGTYFMNEVNKMLGSETYWAERKRIQKARKNVDTIEKVSYPYKLGESTVTAKDMIITPNGIPHYIDEKRYGGNGKLVMSMANGKCSDCGDDNNVVIHHNNGYSNEINDLIVLCRKCHGERHSWKFSNEFPISPTKSLDIEKELDKDIELDNNKKENKKEKNNKNKYGEFGNVALTDDELEKLKQKFPNSWEVKIEKLSSYLAQFNKKYKSHYATILNWARNETTKEQPNKSQQSIFQEKESQQDDSVDYDTMEEFRKLMGG